MSSLSTPQPNNPSSSPNEDYTKEDDMDTIGLSLDVDEILTNTPKQTDPVTPDTVATSEEDAVETTEQREGRSRRHRPTRQQHRHSRSPKSDSDHSQRRRRTRNRRSPILRSKACAHEIPLDLPEMSHEHEHGLEDVMLDADLNRILKLKHPTLMRRQSSSCFVNEGHSQGMYGTVWDGNNKAVDSNGKQSRGKMKRRSSGDREYYHAQQQQHQQKQQYRSPNGAPSSLPSSFYLGDDKRRGQPTYAKPKYHHQNSLYEVIGPYDTLVDPAKSRSASSCCSRLKGCFKFVVLVAFLVFCKTSVTVDFGGGGGDVDTKEEVPPDELNSDSGVSSEKDPLSSAMDRLSSAIDHAFVGQGVDENPGDLPLANQNHSNQPAAAVAAEAEGGNAAVAPVDLLEPSEDAQPVQEVVQIPEPLQKNLADFPSHFSAKDIPVLWHVPKAGGGTVRDILGSCLGLTLACEIGGQFGHENDQSLQTCQHYGNTYINVDTTTPTGIERAKAWNLATSGLADTIVSPYPHEISSLFAQTQDTVQAMPQGRMFAMLRDPIERAASTYGYLTAHDGNLANMTMEQYATSPLVENNWMTRFLSGRMAGELTYDDVDVAKKVLEEKCLIGLLEEWDESIRRFRSYFRWGDEKGKAVRGSKGCIGQYSSETGGSLSSVRQNRSYSRGAVEKGTQAFALLLWQNKFDTLLYKHAQRLFKEQGDLFSSKAPQEG